MAEVSHEDITQLIDLPQQHGGDFGLLTSHYLVLVTALHHSTIYGQADILRFLILAQINVAAIRTLDKGVTRILYAISLTDIVFLDE